MSNLSRLIDSRRARLASVSLLLLVSAFSVLVFAACAAQPEVRQVEITREIPVTREVPVTVVRTETVEITRQVPITREIPVTVEVVKTVEVPVTREVVREIEITREVLVTPVASPTPQPTATPTPSPTPVPVPTPTPLPPKSRFGNWQLDHDFHAGREVSIFRNDATMHEPLPDAPVLTFLCDNRGYRSMYIDWRHPVVGVLDTTLSPYASDPFDIYRQVDADTLLADYARRLHEFVTGVRLDPRDSGRFRELWRQIQRDYDLSELTRPENLVELEEPEEPEDTDNNDQEAEIILSANRGSALIQLDFAVEIPRFLREEWYRPSVRATIRSDWRVLPNQRTLIGASAIGSISQSYRTIGPPRSEEDSQRVITATIAEPEQPIAMFAKWEVTELDRILAHCRSLQN